MSDNRWTWSKELSIPSDTSAGKQVIDDLLAELQQRQWGDSEIFGIHLSVEEALVNAIKHGNEEADDKSVHVVIKMSDDSMRIEITDEGDGFNPDDVPDPTDDENLEVPSGRGIMLMRSFMSLVEFNEAGNKVVMEKQRGGGGDDDESDD